MKRVLAEFIFIVAACCLTLAAFSIFIIWFGVPNSIGLNRGPVLEFLQPAIDFVTGNREPVLVAAVLLLLVVPFTMRLFLRSTSH